MSLETSEVIAADSDAARALLKDFRVFREGKKYVAQLLGGGRIPMEGPRKLLVRYKSWDEWLAERPGAGTRWLASLRLSYLPVSLLPLLITFCASLNFFSLKLLATFVLAVFAVIAFQLGAQFWNDFEDHMRGIDSPAYSGGSGVVQKLWIPAVELRKAALWTIGFGVIAGLLLLFLSDWMIAKYLLGIGVAGALGAAGYSGWPWHYKYLGLGEFIVFFLAGPLLTLGAGLLLSQNIQFSFWYLCIGIPLGILACLRLHTVNMQKIPFDVLAGSRTLATLLPFNVGKKLIFWSMLLPYIVVVAFVFLRILPLASLMVFASFPLVVGQWKLVRRPKSPMDPLFMDLKATTTWLHIVFGICYAVSFLV